MSDFLQKPEDIESRKIEDTDAILFKCNVCGNCCRGRTEQDNNTGVFLSGPDVKRIAHELKMSVEDTISKYVTIIYDENMQQNICKLRVKYSGCCSLLKKGKCMVYMSRPRTCALFPVARAINFHEGKHGVEYANTSYYMSIFAPEYKCEYSSDAPETSLNSWLLVNDVPIEDEDDQQWFQQLLEQSLELKNKKINEDKLRELFDNLYLN